MDAVQAGHPPLHVIRRFAEGLFVSHEDFLTAAFAAGLALAFVDFFLAVVFTGLFLAAGLATFSLGFLVTACAFCFGLDDFVALFAAWPSASAVFLTVAGFAPVAALAEVFNALFFAAGLAAVASGHAPGPESSILKLNGTELQQAVDELYVEAAGYYSLPFVRQQFETGFDELTERTKALRKGKNVSFKGKVVFPIR